MLDAQAIAELRAEGDGLLDELIGMLLEQLPEALKALSEAAARKDADAVAFQAHRLKGSVSNFGAHAMCLLCKSVEMAAKVGDLAQTESLLDSLKTEGERLHRALQRERKTAPGASAA